MHAFLDRASWIWLPSSENNQYVCFQGDFDAPAGSATLFISADSDYACFLNGELAAFNQYDDHPMNKAYDTVPVMLKEGTSRIEIHVWYQGQGCYSYLPGPAGLRFALCDDSGSTLCLSAPGMPCRVINQYQRGEIEPLSGQLGQGFHYDASQPDAPWEKAVEVTARRRTTLYPRPVRKIGLEAPRPVTIAKSGFWQQQAGDTAAEICQYASLDTPSGDQYIIYDLGREEAGLLTLHCSGREGEQMLIAWGEHIQQGRVASYIEGRHFATCYTLKEGDNHFTHYFRRLGCRYLEVLIRGDVHIDYVTLHPTPYPVTPIPRTFENELDQRIWDTSVRTLHLCMHEHYEDTPWREQALYAMDSRNQALFGYTAFGETAFPAAYLDLFREGQREDGLFELCAHAKERFTIPSFALSWVLAVRDHLQYTGDKAVALRMLPAVQNVMNGFMARIDEDGVCVMPNSTKYWNFYEWTEGMDDQDIFIDPVDEPRILRRDAALSLNLLLALEAQAEILDMLALPGSFQCRMDADKLRAAVCKVFYDEEFGAFRTRDSVRHFTQYNQALALISHTAPDEKALRARLAADSSLVPISLSCSLMKYQALLQDDRYRDFVLQDVRTRWGRMLDQDATSFWEIEEGASAYGWAGSLCHGWSAVPVYVYNQLQAK